MADFVSNYGSISNPDDESEMGGGRRGSKSRRSSNKFTMSGVTSTPEEEAEIQREEVGAGCKSILDFPVSIWFIFLNELCERFSYYGMKAILTLYFVEVLMWNHETAISVYHTFAMMCYLTPIFGAIIADTWWGKYKTIILFSLVYAVGHVVKAVSTVPVWFNHNEMVAGTVMGLSLIALGTGGIKPCVCAFGGDQIPNDKPLLKDMFFSVFYVSINIGAFVSMVITPILREDVQCFDKDCYTLAFGVPAGLFLVATVLFVIGTPLYTAKKVTGESMIVRAFGAIGSAFKNRVQGGKRQEHFLYHASPKYDRHFLDELIQLGRIFVMTMPTAIFFMGFDQQGSTWTIQAQQMDGKLGFITLYPDQMQFFNSLLVIILVPITYNIVYPLLAKCHIMRTRLQKMSVGMLLACGAFVMAAMLQFKIDSTLPFTRLTSKEASLWAVNTLPCHMDIRFHQDGHFKEEIRVPHQNLIRYVYHENAEVLMQFTPGENCSLYFENADPFNITKSNSVSERTSYFYFYTDEQFKSILYEQQDNSAESSPSSADCYFSFFSPLNASTEFEVGDETFTVDKDQMLLGDQEGKSGNNQSVSAEAFFDEFIPAESKTNEPLNAKYGGIYLFTMTRNPKTITDDDKLIVQVFPVLEAESVKIYWQIPQYVIITFAEVLVSVTGLDFAYNEAGAGVKSCAQAIWLLGDAVGNLIDIVLFSSILGQFTMVIQFFVVAGIILLGAILFIILACFYQPYEPQSRSSTEVYNEIMESNLMAANELNNVKGKLADSSSYGDSKPYGSSAS
ncbi:solute carrier family 15 member 2-like isoform X2 [Convolutriloba macropyga]|uniref:solute carrier family 15 member 2-like isoform X2 n=1 Tax=Convolutriloba macropyga TaxID=536237 RepID=UPI003F52588D